MRINHVCCALAARCGGKCTRWLELPEAFGVRMAVAKVAQPEEGEIGEYDKEAEDRDEQEQGGKKQACEQPKRCFKATETGRPVAAGRWSRAGKRHYIFHGLDWL